MAGSGYNLIICEICNRPQRTNRSDAKYCSDACRVKAYRARQRNHRYTPCEVCGENFLNRTMRGLYCSPACRQSAYRERIAARLHDQKVNDMIEERSNKKARRQTRSQGDE